MPTRNLHYLLFAEASADPVLGPRWRFVLEQVGSDERLSASDSEHDYSLERLELLAVVRGLEALDGPSQVTLITKSRYVSRGLRRGLADWRANQWQWERFGQLTEVRDADLWKRVDVAMNFHQVRCRLWHFDSDVAAHHSARPSAQPGRRSQRLVGKGLVAGARAGWRRASRAAAGLNPQMAGAGLAGT